MPAKKPIKYEVNKDGCHICISHYRTPKGYLTVMRNNVQYRMNRYIYERTYGEIPVGLHVLHSCDNPSCINPEHLFLGTNLDNIQDKMSKGRWGGGHKRGKECPQMMGERNHQAKLTKKEVLEIRASSLLNKELANIYGVCQTNISRIKNRKAWGWL